MRQSWLIQEDRENCIIFFNGWGMDNNAIAHMTSEKYDVYACSNYESLNTLKGEFTKYKRRYLIAWSLGVFMANRTLANSELMFSKSIAINGTTSPSHNEKGIPQEIFETTLSGWDERNREKFMMRSMGGKKALDQHRHFLPTRSVENQKQSLKDINELINQGTISNTVDWNLALCGYKDLIFSHDNQLQAWGSKAVSIPALPHCLFIILNHWDDIISKY